MQEFSGIVAVGGLYKNPWLEVQPISKTDVVCNNKPMYDIHSDAFQSPDSQ